MTVASTISLQTVSAILLLDINGKRLFSKYYTRTLQDAPKQQAALEKQLHERTKKQMSSFDQNEVVMIDGFIAVYRCNMDIGIYVLGTPSVNELMLACVLDAIFGSFEELLKPQIDKRTVFDHFEQVCLVVDETIDQGIILESEPSEIVARVQRKSDHPNEGGIMSPLSSESATNAISGVFAFAKEKFTRTILKQ